MSNFSPLSLRLFHLGNAIDHVVKTFEPNHSIAFEIAYVSGDSMCHIVTTSTLSKVLTHRFLQVAGMHENAEICSVNENNRWRVDFN